MNEKIKCQQCEIEKDIDHFSSSSMPLCLSCEFRNKKKEESLMENPKATQWKDTAAITKGYELIYTLKNGQRIWKGPGPSDHVKIPVEDESEISRVKSSMRQFSLHQYLVDETYYELRDENGIVVAETKNEELSREWTNLGPFEKITHTKGESKIEVIPRHQVPAYEERDKLDDPDNYVLYVHTYSYRMKKRKIFKPKSSEPSSTSEKKPD